MDNEIKRSADSGDLTALKYVFVDALDVDPTFARYEEDYDYCRRLGLLEPHKELTPLIDNPAQWTESYWNRLKTDLQKNFSERRMEHMRKVARTFMADKVHRIEAERRTPAPRPQPTSDPSSKLCPAETSRSAGAGGKEAQDRELEEARRRLEEENRRTEEAKAEQEKILEAKKRAYAQEEKRRDERFPKWLGIVIAVVVVAVVLITLFQ